MRAWIIIMLVFLPVLGWCWPEEIGPENRFDHYLKKYLATGDRNDLSTKNVDAFIGVLDLKRQSFKKESGFLYYLFAKTHHRFLKQYEEHAPFSDLIEKGRYNCLTGTALYALLLDHFGFDFSVVETNYHIFLLVNTNEGQIMFEATDAQNGFVSTQKAIDTRINLYRENKIAEQQKDRTYYRFSFDLYNEVGLDQLTGLLYYNLAINAFNRQEFDQSVALLDKAVGCYQSDRIKEFSKVIIFSLMQSDLAAVDKVACIKKIQSLRKEQFLR